jgi:hypothetical protein
MFRVIMLTVLVLLAGGCSTPTVYYWGHYQDLIYSSYANPGKVPPEQQVEQLEADYQKARSANKPVPPGFHAYLGYLYSELGKKDQAMQEFETEKSLFPESAVFMDRLLANLKKS